MMAMLALFAVALSAVPLLAVGGPEIRGAIVDASGAAIGGASIQMLTLDLGEVAHTTADQFGRFQMGIPDSGSYVLKVSGLGFRNLRVTMTVRPGAEVVDVGRIRLDLAGCDAPGTICDSFGAVSLDPGVSRGYLRLQGECMLALRRGETSCPDDPGQGSQAEADVRLTRDDKGVYLAAMNGAVLSAPNLPQGDCSDAHPQERRIRIDGLGPGDDICLYTHDGHRSHIFPVEAVSRDSRQIKIWQVTRKR